MMKLDGDKLLKVLKSRSDTLLEDMRTALEDDQLTDEVSYRLHEIMIMKTEIQSGDYTIEGE
jgi:hypothetical protein